jgi:hypothetical protein
MSLLREFRKRRRLAAVVAVSFLPIVGRAAQAPPQTPPGEPPWWKGMARNFWSPQNALVGLVGKDALDCGQFGPDVNEPQLSTAISCAQTAARDRKPFFVIRHFLGPEEDAGPGSFRSRRWLAEGLLGKSDGLVQRFEYQGFFINVFYDTVPPVRPTVLQSPCPGAHAVRDSSGSIVLACGSSNVERSSR